MDGHRGDCLALFEASHTFAELINSSDEIPTRRIGHTRRFGMDSLARQDIRQTDPRRQHFHPHFAILRLWALYLDHLKCIGSAIVSDDDSRVFHEMATPRWGGII